MSTFRIALVVLFGVIVPLQAAGPNRSYDHIDRHALSAPRDVEQSLDRLAAYLTRPARNDAEKTRAIFRWMTDRIAYDAAAYFDGSVPEVRPEAILYRRRGVCSGYTALFEALSQRAGLQTVTVGGHAKGIGHREGQRLQGPGHAWNAVKLDGQWHLLDVTWAAGYLSEGRYVKRFREHYFLTPPEQMILTHLPQDPRWQLLQTPLTQAQFEAMPKVDSQLLDLGVPVSTIWQTMRAPGFPGFVKVFAHDGPVTLHSAPLARELSSRQTYHFSIEAPYASQVVLLNNGHWLSLRRVGPRWEGTLRPEPGDVKLGLQRHPGERMYQFVLDYQVRGR